MASEIKVDTISEKTSANGVAIDSVTLKDGGATFTGTVTVGVDDTGKDVKFFGASSGAYMEWDESADQLRIMGASADATTSTGKLLLATSLTDINANDVIGKIEFQAPHEAGGTDAIEVAASIQAVAQSTFSSSSNATDLIFYTGHSEAAAEKIRITSQNEIGIAGANYGTDGQVLTSGGAGAAVAWEDAAGFDVSSITGATALAEQPALTDEIVLSDAGTLKRLDIKHISNTPCVSVRPSGNQTISNNTWTKVSLQTEVVDSDSAFDSSTNYRWTPGVEGYYEISVSVGGTGGTAYGFEKMFMAIYKNGSALHSMDSTWDNRNDNLDTGFLSATQIVYSDADDYFELYYKFNDTGSSDSNTLYAANTRFAGHRVTGV